MNDQFEFLDIITIVSFALQLQNNENLKKQATNDDILKDFHENMEIFIQENKDLREKIIKQNEQIINLLGGVINAQSN